MISLIYEMQQRNKQNPKLRAHRYKEQKWWVGEMGEIKSKVKHFQL